MDKLIYICHFTLPVLHYHFYHYGCNRFEELYKTDIALENPLFIACRVERPFSVDHKDGDNRHRQ